MTEQDEKIEEIKALSRHYPRRQLTLKDEARWLTDYATDLAAFTVADVRLVCAMWRQSKASQMASPGEMIAKCRDLVKPELQVLPPPQKPPEPVFSEEHKAEMKRRLKALAGEIARKRRSYDRRPGETEVDQGRRLWPRRERRPREEPADPFG